MQRSQQHVAWMKCETFFYYADDKESVKKKRICNRSNCFTFSLYIHVTHLSLKPLLSLCTKVQRKTFHIPIVSSNYAPMIVSPSHHVDVKWIKFKRERKKYIENLWSILTFTFFMYRVLAPLEPMLKSFMNEIVRKRRG